MTRTREEEEDETEILIPLQGRPRHRRFEALTTDAKIIPLIRRRVAFFPMVAARQFSDGDYG